ncbi:hypothetical protein [uncultured Eubacterium sp.]|uniref:hypothetical protein n=1 Tax=uncultured Eubacterium sp. TaxID=165185 RepID=UPI0025976CF8|nr:hypothetical protein [uncultured Eubacterium sp.]
MSKPNSGHFKGTTGEKIASYKYLISQNHAIINGNKDDLREHPCKYKQPGRKKLKMLQEKLEARTITKEEYKLLSWSKRLAKRRNRGIDEFWKEERRRIKKGLPTTRNWSAQQRADILNKKRPKFKGKTIQSHHTYSVAKYPHLANKGKYIQPVTPYEHLYGYHGGNYKNSLPGKPINDIKEF